MLRLSSIWRRICLPYMLIHHGPLECTPIFVVLYKTRMKNSISSAGILHSKIFSSRSLHTETSITTDGFCYKNVFSTKWTIWTKWAIWNVSKVRMVRKEVMANRKSKFRDIVYRGVYKKCPGPSCYNNCFKKYQK